MYRVNELARDIASEVAVQGENLNVVDANTWEAKKNTKLAMMEIEETASRKKGKIIGLIICLAVLVAFLGVIVWVAFF